MLITEGALKADAIVRFRPNQFDPVICSRRYPNQLPKNNISLISEGASGIDWLMGLTILG
jgi:hypothetical protein